MALGEHLARPGEVLADAAAVDAVGDLAHVAEWRSDAETGTRFGVITALAAPPYDNLARVSADDTPRPLPEHLRAWLLPTVYAREQAGQGALLPERRITAASRAAPAAETKTWYRQNRDCAA
jgi:hypothetical protein